MATRLLALPALCLVLVCSAPAQAAERGGAAPEQVVLSGVVTVPRGREAGEIVVLRGSATVAGVALGDVVVLDGPIVVTGQVSGSVVAVSGDVRLGRGAQVRGDVLAGGEVEAAAGARVFGEVREGVRFTLRGWLEPVAGSLPWLALWVSVLLLALVLAVLAPRGLDAVHLAASRSPWACAGWGLLALLGLPALAALLVLSVVGLPLGLAALLSLGLLWLAGYALAAWSLGRAIWRPPRSRWPALLLGWVLAGLALRVPYLGVAAFVAGSVYGFGAAGVAVWGARGHVGRHRVGRAPGVETGAAPAGEGPAPIQGEIGL